MNAFWTELKVIRERFRIRPLLTGNDIARKRIALLVTDCLLRTSKDLNIIHRIPIIESCLWEALKDSTLRCDSLPEEGDHKRYGPGGRLAWEKVYTGNQGHGESTRAFVLEIIKTLTDPQAPEEGREEGGIEDEPGRDHHGKGTHAITGRGRERHVPAAAERPALYTAQSRQEDLFGERRSCLGRKQ